MRGGTSWPKGLLFMGRQGGRFVSRFRPRGTLVRNETVPERKASDADGRPEQKLWMSPAWPYRDCGGLGEYYHMILNGIYNAARHTLSWQPSGLSYGGASTKLPEGRMGPAKLNAGPSPSLSPNSPGSNGVLDGERGMRCGFDVVSKRPSASLLFLSRDVSEPTCLRGTVAQRRHLVDAMGQNAAL